MVVTLGALLADVPHTRPVPVNGLSSDERLVERLDLRPTSYEGPTGIVGVLQSACQDAGIPTASLWASVPHYVAAAPNPKAALAQRAADRAEPDGDDGCGDRQQDVRLWQLRLRVLARDRMREQDDGAEQRAAGDAAQRALGRGRMVVAGRDPALDPEQREDGV